MLIMCVIKECQIHHKKREGGIDNIFIILINICFQLDENY